MFSLSGVGIKLQKVGQNGRFLTPAGFSIDVDALSKIKLIGVAHSHVDREMFPTEDAYTAEIEVVDRAKQVVAEIKKLGIEVKIYDADEYFLANLLVDKPDLIINLVDTYKGKDRLSTSIPAALELLDIKYTGAGMQGFVLGNNRQFTKEILESQKIPTPVFQFIKRKGTEIRDELGLPLIVKLNESGGSVGINNDAVKESKEDAKVKVDEMLTIYKMPVIVEKFIDGSEVTAIVFDDGFKKHVFLGEKIFGFKPDGKHEYTSIESYKVKDSWVYKKHEEHDGKITRYVIQAFSVLRHKDYGKFDIRIDRNTKVPYITDSNPNTAFGPSTGLPIIEVVSLFGVEFEEMLLALISKHAKQSISKNP
jgi:D-alanine-D-alanine ligase